MLFWRWSPSPTFCANDGGGARGRLVVFVELPDSNGLVAAVPPPLALALGYLGAGASDADAPPLLLLALAFGGSARVGQGRVWGWPS